MESEKLRVPNKRGGGVKINGEYEFEQRLKIKRRREQKQVVIKRDIKILT